MGRADQSDRYHNPAITAEWKWQKAASPDGASKSESIFPTPVPPRSIREWYQVVPDGVDITKLSLSIQRLTADNMEEAIQGMERAAKGEHE